MVLVCMLFQYPSLLVMFVLQTSSQEIKNATPICLSRKLRVERTSFTHFLLVNHLLIHSYLFIHVTVLSDEDSTMIRSYVATHDIKIKFSGMLPEGALSLQLLSNTVVKSRPSDPFGEAQISMFLRTNSMSLHIICYMLTYLYEDTLWLLFLPVHGQDTYKLAQTSIKI